ncbi:MAG: ArsR family transcriptional regulator [Bacteroidales bacterium]
MVKIKELSAEKLCVSQISKELNLHRSTIKRYLDMNEDEFLSSNSYKRVFNYKLDIYEPFIHSRLKSHPYLSSAQIHDRLKEVYDDFPNINPKTVYNYVRRIRCKYPEFS